MKLCHLPLAALCLLSLFTLPTSLFAADRTADWKAVADANEHRQPKTASAALDRIITSALADGAHAEAVKAILEKAQSDVSVEKHNEQSARFIRALDAWLADTPPADISGAPRLALPPQMRPLLEAALAKTWWAYYQTNRWQLLRRTQTAESPSDDFLTWDARRVLAETARHFEAALADPAALQRTPIATLEPLLAKGELPDAHRPTLYDFLVHEAIAFYSAGEQGVAKSENAFEPDANSPILGTLEGFLAWQPTESGSSGTGFQPMPPKHGQDARATQPAQPASPILRAIQLYQQLLRFHLADPAPQLALADAELSRINWAAGLLGTPARERHLAALDDFIKRATPDESEIALTAAVTLAHLLESDHPDEAVEVAAHALAKAPRSESAFAASLHNLVARIKAPALYSISTESTWPANRDAPAPDITVSYRNHTKLHFRAYPVAHWEESVDKWGYFDRTAEDEVEKFLDQAPAKTWTSRLPSTPDYRHRNEKISAPRDLRPGIYRIVASLDPQFSEKKNIVSATTVWVSDLALLTNGVRYKDGQMTGLLVNAITGEPVPAATVSAYYYDSDQGKLRPPRTTTTASDGSFTVSDDPATSRNRAPSVLHATAPDGQTIARFNPSLNYNNPPDSGASLVRVTFFTDRSLYRPGQTIQFKAVVIKSSNNGITHELMENYPLTVIIDGPNRNQVGKLELTTNAYGSVTGAFPIPAGYLTGSYRIHTAAEIGSASVSIEEYKRPKFEVVLPAPAAAPKLSEPVTLTGTAAAYTGAPIDGTKVTWRVERLTRWPAWCWWSFLTPIHSAEIAHGATTTDASGAFNLQFIAQPDPTTDPADEPVFHYTISAEVTDTTGETRAVTRTLSVGYTALTASITVPDEWQTGQNPVTLKLSTATLDGTPQTATGTVSIHALKQPAAVIRPPLNYNQTEYYRTFLPTSKNKRPAPTTNSSFPRDWPIKRNSVATQTFTTDAKTGIAELSQKLPAGIYRAIVKTKDRFGKPVTAQTEIRVLAPESPKHPVKEDFLLSASSWKARPGETITALWSTGYDTARAYVMLSQDGKTIRSYWTQPGATQQKIPIEVTEAMRGGITLSVVQVRNNRIASDSRKIEVPWEDKELKITWERFTSKLTPGGREIWTARITAPALSGTGIQPASPEAIAAEFTAALYDASLDQYRPHYWPSTIDPFRSESPSFFRWIFGNENITLRNIISDRLYKVLVINFTQPYRDWNVPIANNHPYYGDNNGVVLERFVVSSERAGFAKAAVSAAAPISIDNFGDLTSGSVGEYLKYMPGVSLDYSNDGDETRKTPSGSDLASPDLSTITARKNLHETAFFLPQLLTDADGSVRIEFTVPEALTRWKFLGFAHDKQLRSGFLTDTAVTAKDLMVQPNPPRFLREGDTVEFTVKVTNMTDQPQTGAAQLTFADASSLAPVDLFTQSKIENPKSKIPFSLPARASTTLSWRITIPDGQGFLTYKAVAASQTASDGEEGYLPVLSRRQLVTESLALSIRDKGSRTFRFDKLAEHAAFLTPNSAFQNESLTIQMTSNPAWYAVLALPSLMEFPHDCSEQLFNRYYANALAARIANFNPKIARTFEQWRSGTASLAVKSSGTGSLPLSSEHAQAAPATQSPLLQNEDLKSLLIEETPWLRAAVRESEQRRAIATLFEPSRTTLEADTILRTLAERQRPDGLWSWFPGGTGSPYITRYLVAGFARLRHFGQKLDRRADAMLKRAIPALDAALARRHAELLAQKDFKPADNHLTPADAHQLYARSFFSKEIPLAAGAHASHAYFLDQITKHWPALPRHSQGHAAIVLDRAGLLEHARRIITSLRERAKNSDELGMYWTDANRGWFWWQAPVETQALMIEVFDEVARDRDAVADLQLWLLKQKQTHAWRSTKATADAVHALLLRGADKLASDALVTVTLGDGSSGTGSSGTGCQPVGSDGSGNMGCQPMSSEHGQAARATAQPGTGYHTHRIPGPAVTPSMGEKITVTKTDAGPAWGSVTWQYFQVLDKIIAHEDTPLTLKKTLYKQINTSAGPTLVALDKTKLEPGDTLIVRIELRTDRDMEFVHLKDQRGSGTEPVNVLSGYRWKNGLGYYESTRDTATHFFIDWLRAGTHVFEYPIRVQLRGRYESGIAEIQCMYAPEYNSHSASTTLVVE